MADNKLNTAEYDEKGRCVRHPAIRLRKKKVFGGWKIIIGHCPECCLDEMRRVRDEIGAEQDGDYNHRGDGGRKEKKKKKKRRDGDRERHRDRDRDRDQRRDRDRKNVHSDNISEVGSEGPARPLDGRHYNPNDNSRTSEATGSTAPNSSMDGNGSVVSDPYIPRYQDQLHGGRNYHHQQPPPPHRQQHQYQQPQQYYQQQTQPPPQRTMVLSMAFTDPQTGQRGTYTGQVNSINHKPDGKGTVYYADGGIAEGSWMNGILMEDEDDQGYGPGENGVDEEVDYGGGQYPAPRARSSSRNRSDPPHGPPSRSLSTRGARRGGGPPDSGAAPFHGNLDRLDQLGGKRRGNQGAAASVGSYRSQGSQGRSGPSGSSSVQNYSSGYGGQSVMSDTAGGGYGGNYGGGSGGYQRQRQTYSGSFHNHNPPGYR